MSKLSSTLLIAMVLLAFVMAGTLHAEPIPTNVLVQPATHSQFRISPSGERLVYLRRQGEASQMIFQSLLDEDDQQPVNFDEGDIRDLTWKGEQTLLFMVGDSLYTLRYGNWSVRKILDFRSLSDGEITSYYEAKRAYVAWQLVDPLLNDPDFVLVSGTDAREIATLYKLDVLSGELSVLADGSDMKASQWMTTAHGVPAMAIRLNSDGEAVHYIRQQGGDRWRSHDKVHQNGPLKLDYDGATFIGARAHVIRFGADPTKLYVAENFTNGRFRIVEYNPVAGVINRVVFEDLKYDAFLPNEYGSVLLSASGRVIGINYLRDRPATQWLDDRIVAMLEKIEGHTAQPSARIVDWSETGSSLLVLLEDAYGRNSVATYQPQTDVWIEHVDLDASLNGFDLPKTETVSMQARDGAVIEAYLTMPIDPDASASLVPLIVMPHGGPWLRSTAAANPHRQFFASHGFAVLDPNFRGSTGYGLDHVRPAIGELGGVMIDDIVDAVDWAVASGIADRENIFILGASYGGYAALMASIRYPDRFAALVSHAAPIDLLAHINYLKKKDRDFAYDYWTAVVGDSRRDRDALRRQSPVNRLDELTVPHLVFHGAKDDIVDVSQSEAFERAYEATGKEANVRVLQRTGHSFGSVPDHMYFLDQSLAHFKKYLTGTAADETQGAD